MQAIIWICMFASCFFMVWLTITYPLAIVGVGLCIYFSGVLIHNYMNKKRQEAQDSWRMDQYEKYKSEEHG